MERILYQLLADRMLLPELWITWNIIKSVEFRHCSLDRIYLFFFFFLGGGDFGNIYPWIRIILYFKWKSAQTNVELGPWEVYCLWWSIIVHATHILACLCKQISNLYYFMILIENITKYLTLLKFKMISLSTWEMLGRNNFWERNCHISPWEN